MFRWLTALKTPWMNCLLKENLFLLWAEPSSKMAAVEIHQQKGISEGFVSTGLDSAYAYKRDFIFGPQHTSLILRPWSLFVHVDHTDAVKRNSLSLSVCVRLCVLWTSPQCQQPLRGPSDICNMWKMHGRNGRSPHGCGLHPVSAFGKGKGS